MFHEVHAAELICAVEGHGPDMHNHGLVMVLVLTALMVRTALMVLVPLKVRAASDGYCQYDGPACV